MNAKGWIVHQLRIGGEMVRNATRSGTMLDASMMVEIVARMLQVRSAKMRWPSKKQMQHKA